MNTGVILACFHDAGTIPNDKDRLNRRQSDGAITWAVFFNTNPGIASGPHAFFGSIDSKALLTSSTVISMFNNNGVVVIYESVVSIDVESPVVNTEWK